MPHLTTIYDLWAFYGDSARTNAELDEALRKYKEATGVTDITEVASMPFVFVAILKLYL